MNETETPVFVRGFSRSGGTMLVTLLDAHPAISMGYELYPNLLNTDDNTPTASELLKVLTENSWADTLAKLKPDKIGVFLARCDRGGLTPEDLRSILEKFVADGFNFQDNRGRMEFMARCCRKKREEEKALHWGLKCNSQYSNYTDIWPNAFFLDIIRDGRDVLASQINTGDFDPDPERIAQGWINTHTKFREFASLPESNGLEVSYEKLVTDPEPETRRICEFLQLDFDESMLDFHKKDLTIYSATHLSMPQISKPLNTSKIGRWKTDVPEETLANFLNVAADSLREFGYDI